MIWIWITVAFLVVWYLGFLYVINAVGENQNPSKLLINFVEFIAITSIISFGCAILSFGKFLYEVLKLVISLV